MKYLSNLVLQKTVRQLIRNIGWRNTYWRIINKRVPCPQRMLRAFNVLMFRNNNFEV